MTLTEKTKQYLKESYQEMKNVTWPSTKEIKQHTVLVIIISLLVAVFLGICDYVLGLGLQEIITLKK